jgi:hypothetical protein
MDETNRRANVFGKGSFDIFLQFVKEIMCDNNDRKFIEVMNDLACVVQNPSTGEYSIQIKGAQQ